MNINIYIAESVIAFLMIDVDVYVDVEQCIIFLTLLSPYMQGDKDIIPVYTHIILKFYCC
jgi:hypothetical protein